MEEVLREIEIGEGEAQAFGGAAAKPSGNNEVGKVSRALAEDGFHEDLALGGGEDGRGFLDLTGALGAIGGAAGGFGPEVVFLAPVEEEYPVGDAVAYGARGCAAAVSVGVDGIGSDLAQQEAGVEPGEVQEAMAKRAGGGAGVVGFVEEEEAIDGGREGDGFAPRGGVLEEGAGCIAEGATACESFLGFFEIGEEGGDFIASACNALQGGYPLGLRGSDPDLAGALGQLANLCLCPCAGFVGIGSTCFLPPAILAPHG